MDQKIEPSAVLGEKSAKKENKVPIILSSLALILGTVGCGLAIYDYKYDAPITFLSDGTDGNSQTFTDGSIADVANRVSDSVVSVVSTVKSTTNENSLYNFFWGYGGNDDSSESTAAGTGVIVSSDGYILTNKHVIEDAESISVVLANGTTYTDVKVAAEDPLNDIAFLKIENVSDLSPATLGNSKTITVGEQVIAIGNALGEYQNTVTSGIISGTGRLVTASDESGSNVEELTDMIQTDAAINSGNSGGPLVNAAGEVIGINTATSSSADGIGFAIPISSVKGMLAQLIESGSASRAYLGVYSINITATVAEYYDLPVTAGAYLYSSSSYSSAVMKNGPAAGLLEDKDIITAVNGTKIGSAGSLSTLIGEYKPGDTVQLTILRSGSEKTVNITLGAYSDQS